jgi:hypothetical protein
MGMMGMMFPIYGFTFASLALVAGVVASHRLSQRPRRVVIAAAILLACGVWTLLRTGGITGDADSDLAWRWSQTPEEGLLAEISDELAAPPPAPAAAETGAEWPGFRGPDREGRSDRAGRPSRFAATASTPRSSAASTSSSSATT